MKFLLSILLLAAMIPAQAQNRPPNRGGNLEQSLDECRRYCAPQCARLVRSVQNQLDDISYSCNFNAPPRRGRTTVKFYKNDTCSDSYLGSVSDTFDCESFARANSSSVWAISINNQCLNIEDTNALSACNAFTNASPKDVVLYKNDSCDNSVIGFIDETTNCERYANAVGNKAVWAVSVKGQCIDIADTDVERACIRYKNER